MMKENKLIKFEITIFLIICIVFAFNLICYFTKNSSKTINIVENLKYLTYNENSYIDSKEDNKEAFIEEKANYAENIGEAKAKEKLSEKAEGNVSKFELKRIDGDTNEPLSNTKFAIYEKNKDGKKEFAKDINGNYIGTSSSEEAIELELSPEDSIWRKNEENIWVADNNGSNLILKSNEFEITKTKTLSLEYLVDCSFRNEGFSYSILNTETNETVSKYTESGHGNGWKKHEIDLEPGKYTISFKYNNDAESYWWLENTAYVKNVQIDPYIMYTVTTDELGKIEMELPENLYEIVEIDVPERYELSDDLNDRTYYFRVGEAKETEDGYTPEWAVSNTGNGMYCSEIKSIIETSDGNYLAGGNFYGTINLDGRIIEAKNYSSGLLVKYSADGKIKWISNVDTVRYITSIIETSDNGYLVLGYRSNWTDGKTIMTIEMLKYTEDGDVSWTNSFECVEGYGETASLLENTNGEYIVTVNVKCSKIEFNDSELELIKNKSNEIDAVIVKYDKNGNVIKANSFGGTGYDYIKSIIKTDDGGYIIGGYYSSPEINLDDNNKLTRAGNYDGFLIRYDQNDQIIWSRNIGGNGYDYINSISDVVDNEFIVGGYFDSTEIKLKDDYYLRNSDGYENVLLTKYNLDGEVTWSTDLGEDQSEGNRYRIESVSRTMDGGFVVGGNFNAKTSIELNNYTIEPRSSRTNVFLIKYDKENEVEWANSVGGVESCWLDEVSHTGNNGFMIAGSFDSRILMIGDYRLKYTSNCYSKEWFENLYIAKLTNTPEPKYKEKENIVVKNYIKKEYRKDIITSKVWKDNNIESRPEKIKLVLVGKVNDTELIKKEVVIPNEETEIINQNTWKYTFESLPKVNVNGNEIVYNIYEEEVNESDLSEYTIKTGEISEENTCEITNIKNGTYNLELIKQDKQNKEKLRNATFKIQVGKEEKEYTTDENGTILIPNINIKEAGTDTIKITEMKSPEGYIQTKGTLEFIVNKVETNEGYLADSIEIKNEIEGATVSLNNGKISVVVDNKKEEILTYNFKLIKRDKTLDINLDGADFSIQIGNNEPKIYTTDENGIIEIPEIEIPEAGTDKISIQEINPPYGYKADGSVIELIVKKEEVSEKNQIIKLESEKTSADVEDAYIEDQTVVLKVCNEKIPYEYSEDEKIRGKYEVEIVKVDKNDKIIENPTTFKVNGKTAITTSGKAKVAEVDITKDNLISADKYEIKEVKSPEGYRRFDGTIEVEVLKKLSDDEGSYKVSNANIIVRDSEGNQLHRGDKVSVKTQNGVTTVTISIVNYEQADLSLRKYITSVSKTETFEETKEIESREPKVDLEKLDSGESTTAKYNHSKETLIVKKGDYILYTLRIYNEGKIDAMASQVADYLPEGLEFAPNATQNAIWNYEETTRKLTTNDKYEAKLLKAHEEGKELDYQDLQVVCRVSENVEEDTNIVNIAEITEIKDAEGKTVEDRDSVPDNIEYPEDLPNYNGGTDLDKTDEYIPGQQDDDDFERILVKSIKGYYDLEIVKVDDNGNIINEQTTKFDINGEKKQTENGKIKIENIEINKTNVEEQDVYVITEEEAPKGYMKYNVPLRIEVSKKVSEDKEKYEIEKVTMKILSGEIVDSEDFEVITENGRTKIVVKVTNYLKPDLSLRKYITSISKTETFEETKEIESREPKVDLEKLDSEESTTAIYNHSKETLIVKKGDYILYTLRIYNEGKIDAIASQVADYLPEGLEFVPDATQNAIWNYEETTRKLTTNDKYEAKLLKAHEEGKELDYQDLQVVCKVSENAEEDTNIVNIAEITEIKDKEGKQVEDRDSVPDDIEYPEDVPNYNGGTDLDKTDEYIPGQQDDDDFERILVKSIKGEYNLKIIKVDENGKIISDVITKFKINDEEKETKDGIIEISKIEINKENVAKKDTYVITEEEAPEGYTKLDETITIEISKKLSEDGESYIIEEPIIVDGEKENNKKYTVSIKDEIVEVMIVNKKIEKPEEPEKTDIPQDQPSSQQPQQSEQQQQQPVQQPSQQQPQVQQSVQQPKSDNEQTKIYTNYSQIPSTGDVLPPVALAIIISVILFNIIQIVISKKKNQ